MSPPRRWEARTSIIVETVVAIIAIAALTIALVAVVISANADRRDLHRMQDAFCRMVVPISAQHGTTDLGRTIIAGAGHAAIVIHCPVAK